MAVGVVLKGLEMDDAAFKSRLRAVRRALRGKNLDVLVVTSPANVTYLTGFCGDDSWAVVSTRGVYLVTDGRYTEQARCECVGCRIVERSGPIAEAVAAVVGGLKQRASVALEDGTSLAEHRELEKKLRRKVKVVHRIVEDCRAVKDSHEAAAIRRAAVIAAEVLDKVILRIRPGVTESEVAAAVDYEICSTGYGTSFATIVAFGANASRPHHRPGRRKLKKNDTGLIDFGVRYKGYCCDVTRCFVVGRVGKLYQQAYDVVRRAQAAAISAVGPGVSASEVDAAARTVVESSGLTVYRHGTGHGLGLEVHELPVIAKNSKEKLRPGMIFTIEPAVYVPGKFGIRIEDDVEVTETGCRILSSRLQSSASFLKLD